MRVVMTSFVERIMWGFGLIGGQDFTFSLGSSSADGMTTLFAIYGAGFASIFGCYVLLYHMAIRRADTLGLDALERYDAVTRRGEMALFAGVGLLGVVLGLTGIGSRMAMGGWVYGLLGPLAGWWGYRRGRAREALSSPASAAQPA